MSSAILDEADQKGHAVRYNMKTLNFPDTNAVCSNLVMWATGSSTIGQAERGQRWASRAF